MRLRNICTIVLIAAFIFSVRSDFEPFPPTPEGQKYSNEVAFQVLSNYTDIAWAMYADAVRDVVRFNMAVYHFRKDPGPETLQNAKDLWIDARKTYGKTECFRFSETPIDELGLEILINAWPVDESYIDYTRDDRDSGIINQPDRYPKINSVYLPKLNEQGGEANVSTGWHTIEFLLWGQDFDTDGPGNRPWTDFTTAKNADRRMTYLVTATEVLRSHLVTVSEEWNPANYDGESGEFFIRHPSRIIRSIMTGIGSMAGREIADERLAAAIRSGSQENEYSCFSDTTHNDLVANMEGLESILFGKFINKSGKVVIDGKGIIDIISSADKELAGRMETQFRSAMMHIEAIPRPFDQIIVAPADSEGRKTIDKAISSLWEFVYSMSVAEKFMELNTRPR